MKSALDSIPRMGWVASSTPITHHPVIAEQLRAAAFVAKRDDQTQPFAGSSKTRKLDYLLAQPRYANAQRWASVGAIGSGSLVAISSAAEHLGVDFDAYMFWESISPGVIANFCYTAERTKTIHYVPNRLMLGLKHPMSLIGKRVAGAQVIPAGATTPLSTLGLVRAGLELAEDVRLGDLSAPDIVVCPHGTGGMAAGLSIGLALGGLSCSILAVSAVEKIASPRFLHVSLVRRVLSLLADNGVVIPVGFSPRPVTFDFDEVGPGYGVATDRSLTAAAQLVSAGIPAEAVYSGKAMAGLSSLDLRGKSVLFWVTPRAKSGSFSVPNTIPAALARRLSPHWR